LTLHVIFIIINAKEDGSMESNTVNLSIRMDKELKEQAESLFSALGMNMTTALNIFLRQAVRQRKIPFEISLNIPNIATLEAIKEAEDMKIGKVPKYQKQVLDLVKELGE
jgi:DNA-damage-inducible protein J